MKLLPQAFFHSALFFFVGGLFLEDFELSKEPLLLLIRVCAADPAALPVCPPPAPIHPQRWPSIPKSSCGKDQTPVSGRDRAAQGSLPLLMERRVGTAHTATGDFQGSPGPCQVQLPQEGECTHGYNSNCSRCRATLDCSRLARYLTYLG